MNYMQLKTGPGAVSGEEREGFCLKGALQGLGRWIKQCAELERELERSGYQKNRKFFLKSEVELIVRFLGEP